MAKSLSFVTPLLVAAVLAVPTVSAAQGRSRGGDDGGSSGGRSGSGSGEVAVPRSAPEPAPAPAPRASEPSSPQPTYGSESGSNRSGSGETSARARGDQPIRGYAQPRTNVPRGGGGDPTYVTVWPSWYYGGYYGYSGYPYGYYGGLGYWNRYGLYDPFLFDPYGYYGGFYGSPAFGSSISYGESSREPRSRDEISGSIRLKVNPKNAKVYVDGALAGTADEFDGLGGHLQISAGPHQIELRADGFQTYAGTVNVKEDRTQTERITLKKR
ncbi:MAG: PEGA domain-containing protein [Acidobacteriota bacterium]